jgi:RNA polymerase sigma-70 factor (ECF subfamily)
MLRGNPNPIGAAPRALNPADVDDAALLTRVATGDMRAFETLYRRYFPRLCRFVERMTRRPALVEEIINDTLFVVFRNAHKYEREAKPSTWIFAIAYRKGLKALKRLDEPVEADDELAWGADESEPKDALLQWQQQELLGQALKSLSVKHRTVVELTYFHGADYREIAGIMDCPVDTVKTRMFHARRQLKALLSGNPEDML